MALKDDLKDQFSSIVRIEEFNSTIWTERCVAFGIETTHYIQRRRPIKEAIKLAIQRLRPSWVLNRIRYYRGRLSDWIAPDGWND